MPDLVCWSVPVEYFQSVQGCCGFSRCGKISLGRAKCVPDLQKTGRRRNWTALHRLVFDIVGYRKCIIRYVSGYCWDDSARSTKWFRNGATVLFLRLFKVGRLVKCSKKLVKLFYAELKLACIRRYLLTIMSFTNGILRRCCLIRWVSRMYGTYRGVL